MDAVLAELEARAGPQEPKLQRVKIMLDAMTEIIQQQAGDPTVSPSAADLFMATMATLERCNAERAIDAFHLLAMVLPHVAPAALRGDLDRLLAALNEAFRVRMTY